MIAFMDINGEKVRIQIVRRKNGTEYVRLAPDFWNPSEAQKAVRDHLTMTAYRNFGKSREEINRAIKTAYIGWPKQTFPKKKESKLEKRIEELEEEYGTTGTAESVKTEEA